MKIGKLKISFKMPAKYDFWMHFAMIILMIFGTIMIISASSGSTAIAPMITFTTAIKQVAFVVISYLIMLFLANNFTMVRARRYGKLLGIIFLVLLVITLFLPDVGNHGAKSWIRIGSLISIQPSEFVKVLLVVLMAVYVEIAGRRNFDFWTIVKVPVFFYLAYAAIIILQPDFGTLMVITIMCGVCFLVPSHVNLRPVQKWTKILIIVGFALALFLMSPQGLKLLEHLPLFRYQIKRFETSLNPFLDPFDTGYQLMNGLYAIARGGIFGVGLGNSTLKFGFLTQSGSDYIMAITIEELGVFGFLVIIIGYIIIIQRLLHYALKTKSEGYKIILIGTAMYIFVHFVLNAGGVSGLIPLTGVPLLFISSGGSSLMSIMAAMGISQAIISRIRRQGE